MIPPDFDFVFWTIIFIVGGLSPVLGLSLFVTEFNIKKRYLTFIKRSLPTMGITYFILGLINNSLFKDNEQILIYSIAISLLLHFLQSKNPGKDKEALAQTLIVTYIFFQYWEVPLFIMAHLNIPPFTYHGSIDQAYLILVSFISLKFTEKTIDKIDLALLSIPLLATTIAFIWEPVAMSYVDPLYFIVRSLSCFCLGKFFIRRRLK